MPGSRQNLQRHLVLFVNKLKVFFITASQIHSLGFIVLLVAATSEFQLVIVFGWMSKISWNWQLYVKIFSLTLTWVLFCNCSMWNFVLNWLYCGLENMFFYLQITAKQRLLSLNSNYYLYSSCVQPYKVARCRPSRCPRKQRYQFHHYVAWACDRGFIPLNFPKDF